MRNNRNFGRRGFNLKKLIPVLVDGQYQTIPVGAIPKSSWKHAHGTAPDGTEVHSARFATYGDSTIIMSENGHAISIPTPDAYVLGMTLAEEAGCKVTAPTGRGSKRA